MNAWTILLFSAIVGHSSALAQKTNLFSVHAGYLYSTSALTETTIYLTSTTSLKPKSGFYAGLAYEHSLSTILISQVELTYQQKGYISQTPISEPPLTNTYRYLSLTPMIGIKPIKNFRLLIGPTFNLFLSNSMVGANVQLIRGRNQPIEIGLAGHSSYQFGRVGITAGYFRGLTAYYKEEGYYLTNQNWQLGLLYQLSKR